MKSRPRSTCRIALLTLGLAGIFRLIGAPPRFACIQELAVPKYPALARQARIQGIVEVRVELKDSSKPATIIISDAPLLRKAVANAMESSRFLETCTDNHFTIVFSFELDLSAPPRTFDEGAVVIRWPGTVIIRATRFPISGSSAAVAPKKRTRLAPHTAPIKSGLR